MYWRLILKYFGPNIKHIYEVENILSYMLSRFFLQKLAEMSLVLAGIEVVKTMYL